MSTVNLAKNTLILFSLVISSAQALARGNERPRPNEGQYVYTSDPCVEWKGKNDQIKVVKANCVSPKATMVTYDNGPCSELKTRGQLPFECRVGKNGGSRR